MGIAADFVLIVLAGLAGGILARLLRLPLLAGYVVAGVVVGPHTAGPSVTQIKDIGTLAEIGAAMITLGTPHLGYPYLPVDELVQG
ncbi:MAG: hypothetical protein FJW30_15425 [Acidobacteria bacterium]|nr:hypothetical protein [Acidobacteriota bacterium]